MNAHPNTLYVVSAGNESADAANSFPCNSPAANLVCVGASSNVDAPADFSNGARPSSTSSPPAKTCCRPP